MLLPWSCWVPSHIFASCTMLISLVMLLCAFVIFCCICIMIIIVVCIFVVCLLSLWTPSPHLLCCSILPFHLNHHQVQHPITSFFLSILTHLLQVAFSCPSKMFTYFGKSCSMPYTSLSNFIHFGVILIGLKNGESLNLIQTWFIFPPLKMSNSIL